MDYPDTLWCYGNHDVSYPWGRLKTGYSPYAERTVISKLEELENSLKSLAQINIIHRIDNVLFSHGGLTADFLKWINADLLFADIDDVIAAVNDASHDYLWNDKSPLWLRPQYETREIFRADTYKQVIGQLRWRRYLKKTISYRQMCFLPIETERRLESLRYLHQHMNCIIFIVTRKILIPAQLQQVLCWTQRHCIVRNDRK